MLIELEMYQQHKTCHQMLRQPDKNVQERNTLAYFGSQPVTKKGEFAGTGIWKDENKHFCKKAKLLNEVL